jgi:protein phosphatase
MKSYGITVSGKHREINEDSIFLNDDIALYIVADGMGGHEHGDLASSIAVKEINGFLREKLSAADNDQLKQYHYMTGLLNEAVNRANWKIFENSRRTPPVFTMGTTVSFALIKDGKCYIAHVGDSRIYRLRQGDLKKLTHDHSMVQELVDRGEISEEEALDHPLSNMVTRALGSNVTVEADTYAFNIQDNDCFLLTSDGLSKVMDINSIREILESDISIKDKCETIIERTRQAGAPDDVSVIILNEVRSLKSELILNTYHG